MVVRTQQQDFAEFYSSAADECLRTVVVSTVAKQANGDIEITIKQLQHPAQLQATLRADGLPAHVSFAGGPGRAVCQPYSRNASWKFLYRTLTYNLTRSGSDFLTIHPSQLPSGLGLSITVEKFKGRPGPVTIGLVYASPQCTGMARLP